MEAFTKAIVAVADTLVNKENGLKLRSLHRCSLKPQQYNALFQPQ